MVPHALAAPKPPQHRQAETGRSDDFRDLVSRAEGYMQEAGLAPNRDPLFQVLGSTEVAGIEGRYEGDFGDVAWDESDYLVVVLAGFVATLLDACLVRIPTDGAFLGRMQQGSPLTKWLRENSASVHRDYLGHLEKAAKVPCDLPIGDAVDGLRPKVHRLMSPGHDPVLGFVFGVKDMMDGTGTYVDKNGDLVPIGTPMSPEGLTVAFLTQALRHDGRGPGLRRDDRPRVVAVPELREQRRPRAREGEADLNAAARSHDCGLREPDEDGAIFGMNPLVLDWAQMLRLFPATTAWVRESLKRDRTIRGALDEEWLRMYRAGSVEPESG